MKLIIRDHFRRWWWVVLPGGIAYGGMTAGVCLFDGHNPLEGVFPCGYLFGLFIGSFLLSMDSMRGHTRALLTLPVTSKQVGRAWWWVSVGLPVVILGVITALVIGVMLVIAPLLRDRPILVANALNYWLTTSFLLGTTFFALTGMTGRPGGVASWREGARLFFFGILWIGTFGFWFMFKNIDLQRTTGVITFVITSLLTVLGWFRAEAYVLNRGGLRITLPSAAGQNAKPSRCAEGRGGLWFLFQSTFNRMTLAVLTLFPMFGLVYFILPHGALIARFGDDSMKELYGAGMSAFIFPFWWAMSFQMITVVDQLRYLRTLPVSAGKLAALLVFAPLLAMIVALFLGDLLLAVVAQTPPLSPEKLFRLGFFPQIALATTFIPLLVWRGLSRLTFFLMFIMLLAVMSGWLLMFSGLSIKSHLLVWASGAISLLIPVGSFIVTKLILERSSTAYRPRPSLLTFLQMGAGR